MNRNNVQYTSFFVVSVAAFIRGWIIGGGGEANQSVQLEHGNSNLCSQ